MYVYSNVLNVMEIFNLLTRGGERGIVKKNDVL